MQLYTVYFWKTALHLSGGISTHHQEHIQLYLQHLALVKPLLLPATIVGELELHSANSSRIEAGSSYVLTISRCCRYIVRSRTKATEFSFSLVDTVLCTPDDGWSYHPKHVERYPEINKLCNFIVQGSLHRKYIPFDIFPTRCNITQFIYLWNTALHSSVDNSTHHQEHIQMFLQYLALFKPLLLPPAMVEELELV